MENPGLRLPAVRVLEVHQGQLVGQKETLPAVALDQGVPDRALAFPAVVEIGGIKVCIAPRQESVHHAADLGQVNLLRGLRVHSGQAHHAKA